MSGYEYKFVRVERKRGLWTAMDLTHYQQVIRQHAAEGWRFVQVFDLPRRLFGAPCDLIFEKGATE